MFIKNQGQKLKSTGKKKSNCMAFYDMCCFKRPQIEYTYYMHEEYQVQQIKGIQFRPNKVLCRRFQKFKRGVEFTWFNQSTDNIIDYERPCILYSV